MPHVLQDAAPTPQNLANVFSAADSTSSHESSQSLTHHNDWRHSTRIQQSILACGKSTEESSHALTLALKDKSVQDVIISQTGAIIPCEFAMAMHHQQQKSKVLAVAQQSNGNSCKQTTDCKMFVATNLVTIVTSPEKKTQKDELFGIQCYLPPSLCVMGMVILNVNHIEKCTESQLAKFVGVSLSL
jgi:hypothetical protein